MNGRKIAEHLAKILPSEKTILIDAFAGAGGNSIAFALSGRFKQIFAIEKDPEVIKCAKHNAEIYGVKNKIFFVKGDCFEVLPQNYKKIGQKAVIFASPPWGGIYPRIRVTCSFQLTFMKVLDTPRTPSSIYRPWSHTISNTNSSIFQRSRHILHFFSRGHRT